MGRFFDALKAGFKDFDAPRGFTVAGRPVRCPHCGETKFVPRDAMLNTRGATMVNLDWLNPTANILTCAECGRIEWFAQEPLESS